MKIALATDHAGFEQLKDLEVFLETLGHECINLGPITLNQDDDYPDFVMPAANAVASGKCERGVIMGGSGEGEAIAANRIKGIRCALYYGPAVPVRAIDASGHQSHDPHEIIKLSREHNDSNMISFAARFVTFEDMKLAVKLWLETPFSDEPQHKRRIAKIDSGEK